MAGNSTEGDVNHSSVFCFQFLGLLYDDDIAKDVCFKCGEKIFWCHRVILAARSTYFKALLYGHMKEAEPNSIINVDVDPHVFEVLIKYLYSATLRLSEYPLNQVTKLLELAHHYQLTLLREDICNYLKTLLNLENALVICQLATFYDLTDLQTHALRVIDRHPKESLNSLSEVSHYTLLAIISRDSFPVDEVEIFEVVQAWVKQQEKPVTHDDIQAVLKQVRLSLIPPKELFLKVQPSELYKNDELLLAIKKQTLHENMDLPHRGVSKPDVNLLESNDVVMSRGKDLAAAVTGPFADQGDSEQVLCSHVPFDPEGILLKLSKAHIINTISFQLPSHLTHSYSYKVSLSVDGTSFKTLIDYSDYHCHGWQHLYLPVPKTVAFIKIVGTWCYGNHNFTIKALRVLLDTSVNHVTMDEKGIIEPKENVATIERGAIVIEGVSRKRSTLLNGNTVDYNWEEGYTCHQVGSGAIIVQLNQPYILGAISMLLWDCDTRSYSYIITVSPDRRRWKEVVNKGFEQCSSWQYLTFEKVPVSYIKIVGTQNSANSVFHLVHLETGMRKKPENVTDDEKIRSDEVIETVEEG